MLDEIASILKPGDTLQLHIERRGDALHVIAVPRLADADLNDPDPTVRKLTAFLARPFVATLPLEGPDGELRAQIDRYVADRSEVVAASDQYALAAKAVADEARTAKPPASGAKGSAAKKGTAHIPAPKGTGEAASGTPITATPTADSPPAVPAPGPNSLFDEG